MKKYLKESAEILIGKAGVQSRVSLSDYTATLVLPTHYSDGSGDDLLGVQVTRKHLKQLRNEIDRYLISEVTENKPEPESVELVNNLSFISEIREGKMIHGFVTVKPQVTEQLQNRSKQKQTQLIIDPKVVIVNQLKPTGKPDSWFAKICVLTGVLSDPDGKLEVSVLGNSEENVRAKLNTGFHDLIMACINPDSLESKIPDIVHKNQQLVNSAQNIGIKPLEFESSEVTLRRTNEVWEAKIVYGWKGYTKTELTAFGNTETEARTQLYQLLERLKDSLSADRFSVANKAEDIKQISSETDNKDSTPLKLNPNRVMSIKVGVGKWEARTKIFNGINDELIDLVTTASSEEEAREELDKKFSIFAKCVTNFIKATSQAS